MEITRTFDILNLYKEKFIKDDVLAGKEQGVMRIIKPGDEKSRVLFKGHLFDHLSVSKDMRFLVSETYDTQDATSEIVIGSIKTGKTRVLLDTGSDARIHDNCPEPYFTPDCKWVIFNSGRTGSAHIYAATVPEELLKELEQE